MVHHPDFAGSVASTFFSRRFAWGCAGLVAGLFAFVFAVGILIGRSF